MAPSIPKCLILLQTILSSCVVAKYIPASKYVLQDLYTGKNFFNAWNFVEVDYTNGFVEYVDQKTAQRNGLINANNGPAYIGVDHTSVLNGTTGSGRKSVRIESKKTYNASLIIGDFNHMPGGLCATWPAFWSYGPNWPYSGEIDILEGQNLQKSNLMSLHAGPNCTTAGHYETGRLLYNDCYQYAPDEYGSGCGVQDRRTATWGDDFNENGGGVYATQWTDEYIRIWFFPRWAIPKDIQQHKPNPASWGKPAANFQGGCNFKESFHDHVIVINIEICGSWAGPAFENYPQCAAQAKTCVDYAASKPAAFKNAYWSVNYVAVYHDTPIAHSSTMSLTSSAMPTSYVTPVASITSSSVLSEKPPMGSSGVAAGDVKTYAV